MDFQTAVKTCVTEKYMTFSGRASRSEYWWFFLAAVIVGLVLSVLHSQVINAIYSLVLFLPASAAGARRLQDTGRPGWWIFIPMGLGLINRIFMSGAVQIGPDGMPTHMPGMFMGFLLMIFSLILLVVSLVFIWWLTRPSEQTANAYGPPPAA
ncbi:DUF805 domain-containing protein [Aquicoccus sp. G2-2]|jgi:uncharacterized membrane protein YhaH (DUF805 family)|uniref:DUF805 domain-containing protein n=1 Tax=Aquicoccus sp. G2-2 TaxID=3092120 RepID=UPI002ADF6B40|nr:DUF805 domain-containing protein [Aquicoccus sp. G2-2]MEA1112375.1 DUF805 domain-containing protein [Aquicoccus sp. G2-2]